MWDFVNSSLNFTILLLNNPNFIGWIQALCYFIAFVILYRQLHTLNEQAKLQTKAILDSDYLRCQIDYTETLRLLIMNNKFCEIYDDLAENIKNRYLNWKSYNEKQKVMYGYLLLLYEMYERAFAVKKEGGMDDIEWGLWDTWIKEVAKHPLFSDIYQDNKGLFDSEYEEYIKKTINSTKKVLINGS